MGRMDLLSHICNPASGQVEGFCIVKSVQQKTNAKGAEYLDFILEQLSDLEGVAQSIGSLLENERSEDF